MGAQHDRPRNSVHHPFDRQKAHSASRSLPVPLTSFIGRDGDIAQIVPLLRLPEIRLLTLTGPPGIGKTRLALEAARVWQEAAPEHWVCFVALAPVRDARLLLPAVARALGLRPVRTMTVIEHLGEVLVHEPPLLVLDSFEHLPAAAETVIELLRRFPSLRILITSRVILSVQGEHIWRVRPLPVPDTSACRDLDALARFAGVELFLDRARMVDLSFALNDGNAAAIATICARLEGIPLAIELAAGWLKICSPASLVNLLDERPNHIPSLAKDLPDRQRTLANAVAGSVELLSEHEERLFARLGAFDGGWTMETAWAVVADPGDSRDRFEATIVALADRSLIERDARDGHVRFRMFAMIRAYALDGLAHAGDTDAVMDRYAACFSDLAAEAANHLYGCDQAIWLDRLEIEMTNLRAALQWMIDRGDKRGAIRMTCRLENFWILHDRLLEGRRWLEAARALPNGLAIEDELAARNALATLMLRSGEHEPARRLLEQNLGHARRIGNRALAAESLHSLGIAAAHAGDESRRDARFAQAMAIAREIGEERVLGRVLNHQACFARLRGDDAGAIRLYDESLSIWRRIDDRERVAMVLHNVAPALARVGASERAVDAFSESLAISRDLRNVHGIALSLAGIAGMPSVNVMRAMQAAQLLGAADALRASIGVQWDPADQAEFKRSVGAVLPLLGAGRFDVSVSRGAGLTLDEAVDLAHRFLAGSRVRGHHARPSLDRLTRRETEVSTLVALGCSNREIAGQLSISEKTVEMHLGHAFEKLAVHSRTQLAAWIVEQRMETM